MASRCNKEYRQIGLTFEHSKWLEDQAGGPRGISNVVNKCIARTMRHNDALDRLDLLGAEVTSLSAAAVHASQRMERLTRFLEFQVWLAVGKDEARFDAWLDEFEQFCKGDDDHANK